MSELPPPSETRVAIPYATREDTGLAAAYRLVGWFYLATAIITLVSSVSGMAFAMMRGGVQPWSNLAIYAATLTPRLLSIVGAVAMIRTRGWGAIALAATFALALVLGAGTGLLQYVQLRATMTSWFVYSSLVSGILSNAVMALFPLAMWRICRNKDVLRRA